MADPTHTIESDGGYIGGDDYCPQCGAVIRWIRGENAEHHADCRPCMVVWRAKPGFVRFDLTPLPATVSSMGQLVTG